MAKKLTKKDKAINQLALDYQQMLMYYFFELTVGEDETIGADDLKSVLKAMMHHTKETYKSIKGDD